MSSSDKAAAAAPAADTGSGQVRIKGFVAGTASGLTKLVVGHPFDLLKVRLQCSPPGTYSGVVDVFLKTVRLEGPRALYKGVMADEIVSIPPLKPLEGASPPAVGWAISDSMLLGSLHNYRLFWARFEARQRGEAPGEEATQKLSLLGHTLSGTMAGMTVCAFITPIEHIKARLQMQTVGPKLYSGPLDCVKQVYRANGVLGLWHGFGSTLLFRSWFGAMFCSYEILMRGFKSVSPDSPWKVSIGTANFLAGGISSNVFWLGSFPFDSIKNRLMTDSITNPKYPTWRSAAKALWAEGKVRALYRGFVPCLLRAFPTNASALFVWETSMRLMGAEQVK